MKSTLYRILAILGACFATPWAAWHERRIKAKGRTLSTLETTIAKALGIDQPEAVYIQVVDRVPNPLFPFLYLAKSCGASCITEAAGITLGKGIYISVDHAEALTLITHELVHVEQYQRAGSIWSFMVEYLHQCLMVGYFDAEWEIEARNISEKTLHKIS